MKWDVLDTGLASAEENMAIDTRLLKANLDQPVLHLYDWKAPSATYGYFIRPEEHLNLEHPATPELARRPTGGGIVFHTADLAFSLILPPDHPVHALPTLERYWWVNEKVMKAIGRFDGKSGTLLEEDPGKSGPFCMAKPTIFDILIGEKKVGGAAQRRTRTGLLHQGTISLGRLSEDFLSSVLKGDLIEVIQETTHAPLGSDYSAADLANARVAMKGHLVDCLTV